MGFIRPLNLPPCSAADALRVRVFEVCFELFAKVLTPFQTPGYNPPMHADYNTPVHGCAGFRSVKPDNET